MTKKLIEVSLPLEAINEACVEEKFIRTGHPANLHQWWSRKPLVAARAVLFASLVDDPSEYLDNETKILEERERLFRILEQLARWENSDNQSIMDKARLEIARSLSREKELPVPVGRSAVIMFLQEYAPTVMDPFAGGGSIPFEAQRLGLPAHASDLNPDRGACQSGNDRNSVPVFSTNQRYIKPKPIQSKIIGQGLKVLLKMLSSMGNGFRMKLKNV